MGGWTQFGHLRDSPHRRRREVRIRIDGDGYKRLSTGAYRILLSFIGKCRISMN